MSIGIIGYGSLIWDLDDLEPHINGEWQRGGGPEMPVEFCRISPKRKMGLVLALDPNLPAVSTSVIQSKRDDVHETIADLAARERAPAERIGYLTRNGDHRSQHDSIVDLVADWLNESTYQAVVWTDLEANFSMHYEVNFNHANAVDHLQSLDLEQLAEAWRYISYAPAETQTPFRSFLQQHKWWQSLSFDGSSKTEQP